MPTPSSWQAGPVKDIVGPASGAALAMVVDVLVKLVYRIAMGNWAVRQSWPRAEVIARPSVAREGASAPISCINESVKFFD